MESARDVEVGHESIDVLSASKPQRDGCQYSGSLNEPFLKRVPNSAGSDGSLDYYHSYEVPGDMRGLLPERAYVPLSSDEASVLEIKREIRRFLCNFPLHRERISDDDEVRRRMIRGVTTTLALHLAFMGALCVAVYGGYVDGKPWSVVFWLMLVELAVLLVVLALKMAAVYEFEHRTLSESLKPELNIQKMPALRERLGAQKFKDLVNTVQMQLDQICALAVKERAELSFCEMVKSHFHCRCK